MNGPAKKYRKIQQLQQSKSWLILLIYFSYFLANGMNGDSNSELITRAKAESLGIPKRWLYCPPMGKVILTMVSTLFIFLFVGNQRIFANQNAIVSIIRCLYT